VIWHNLQKVMIELIDLAKISVQIYPINEIRVNPGPRNIPDNAQTPYDFFKLLFTEEMMEALCDFTNAYAEQWKSSCRSVYET
jgi:hypothetical protein